MRAAALPPPLTQRGALQHDATERGHAGQEEAKSYVRTAGSHG